MSRSQPNRRRLLQVRVPVSPLQALVSSIGIWVVFFGGWILATSMGWVNPILVPSPEKVFRSIYVLFADQGFANDVLISVARVLFAFALACVVAVPAGVAMGAFPAIDAVLAPFVSAWRYLPAPSFIPILLMWFGTGEEPKIALLFLGVIFFLITLIADHTKDVRKELIETAMTLGAGRWITVFQVMLPAVLPNILVAMRQMLAVVWTYLVIAEIVASTTGIGAMMMRARRFLHTDQIMAGIIVIGVLGLVFDRLFALLHRRLFPYLQESR
ncbi:hypothetical protein U879_07665 [Defluviimonas sp. 20V17]|uniref:ABC transporter permease n=1 Tax=Allgaiera indica TaxID=765699 RepID=A0AAN5A0L0_9RHOB|nr:ABC transporter permease [Allgaiera indica]KDB04266.1 hypothetical protein U879_07665 [Defluviimonas sp. 20V17]GHE03688.1 ABC transporter permease [Allgaiera indica]SDX74441.1 NitT/TauT family transport system permease protein [Allgaiera indica]